MWRPLNHWTTKQRCKPSKPPGNSDPWRLWPLQKDDTPATSQTTCSEIAEECGKELEASTPRTRSDLEGPSLQPAESTAKVLVPDITGWSQRSCVLVSMGQIQVRCTSLQWLIRRLWWPGLSGLYWAVLWCGGVDCRAGRPHSCWVNRARQVVPAKRQLNVLTSPVCPVCFTRTAFIQIWSRVTFTLLDWKTDSKSRGVLGKNNGLPAACCDLVDC